MGSVFLAYPLRIVNGTVATTLRSPHITQMIEQVLFTMPGERVMYPDFGVGIERLVFERNAGDVAAATQSLVSAALQKWLGDVISVHDVRITVNESTLAVDVVYQLIDTREIVSEHYERNA